MPLAWTTPDTAPGSEICRALFIPSGGEYEAAARGALLELIKPENWEKVGAQTPEAVASAFADSILKTFEQWRSCLYVGQVIWTAGAAAPAGTLDCDGGLYDRDEYAALFAAIGTVFGTTSGSNFRVPNLEGRVIVGSGQSPEGTTRQLSDTGGSETVTLVESEMPGHGHSLPDHVHSVHAHLSALAVAPGELPVTTPNTVSGSTGSAGSGATGSAGSGDPHENMQPFIVLHPKIVTGK